MEREALAIVWAIEHFHLYLYGSNFNLEADHRPLELILNNPRSKPPACIKRWNLQLQPYNFRVMYRTGKNNPDNYMSRHPNLQTPSTSSQQEKVAEQYINFLSAEATPKAVTLQEIEDATKADRVLQQAIEALHTGQWTPAIHQTPAADKPALQALKRVQRELSTNSDGTLLLKGSQIILPVTLEQRVLTLAHEGHQGVVKSKQLLREKVWFLGINHKVELTIKNCIPCQACTPREIL